MAYFFTGQFAEDEGIVSGFEELERLVKEWHARFDDSVLCYLDNGAVLVVFDLRRGDRLYYVDGIEAEICRSSDAVVTIEAVSRNVNGGTEAFDESLHKLIEHGLVVREGGSILCLANHWDSEFKMTAQQIARVSRLLECQRSSSVGHDSGGLTVESL